MHVCRLSYSSLTTHPRTSLSFVFLAASHPHAKSKMAFHYFVRSTMFWEKRLWPRFRLKIYKFLFLYQNFLCPHEAFLARFRPSTGILFVWKPKISFYFFIVACRPHVTDENEELSKNDGRCIRPRNVIVNEQFRFHVSIREHENGVFKNSYSREGFGKLRFRWPFSPGTCGRKANP